MDVKVGPDHFEGALEPFGSGALTVAVGGMAVRFEGLSDVLLAASLDRYEPFLSEEPPLHTVRVAGGLPKYLDPAEDSILRMEEHEHHDGPGLHLPRIRGLSPHGGGPGILRVSPDLPFATTRRHMENYLRWTVADLALDRDGFVLHSAGLVRAGKAYIFFGHSGAGKSTATAMSVEAKGALALSDDLVLLLKEGTVFKAATTPFWGTMPQKVKERGVYPLAAIFHLRQSPEVRTASLSPALATGMVLSCCPFVASTSRRTTRLVPLVEDLCRSVPVKELHFKKDPSFWDVIAGTEGTK